jgi:hypothetical protein
MWAKTVSLPLPWDRINSAKAGKSALRDFINNLAMISSLFHLLLVVMQYSKLGDPLFDLHRHR